MKSKKAKAATKRGVVSAPGCSANECQICHVPFEFGDIMIGKDGGRKFCYYCAAKAADMFETTSALIGKVTEVENGWEVAFAPDCTTWITVRRDEYAEPTGPALRSFADSLTMLTLLVRPFIPRFKCLVYIINNRPVG